MLKQDELVTDRYYIGVGRFLGGTQVAFWNGNEFLGMATDCGFKVVNEAEYGDNGFVPLAEVASTFYVPNRITGSALNDHMNRHIAESRVSANCIVSNDRHELIGAVTGGVFKEIVKVKVEQEELCKHGLILYGNKCINCARVIEEPPNKSLTSETNTDVLKG